MKSNLTIRLKCSQYSRMFHVLLLLSIHPSSLSSNQNRFLSKNISCKLGQLIVQWLHATRRLAPAQHHLPPAAARKPGKMSEKSMFCAFPLNFRTIGIHFSSSLATAQHSLTSRRKENISTGEIFFNLSLKYCNVWPPWDSLRRQAWNLNSKYTNQLSGGSRIPQMSN